MIKTKRGSQFIGINMKELNSILKGNKDAVLLDVRSIAEYKEGHINGAIVVANYELHQKIRQIVEDKNTLIIVYCKSEIRSKIALETLKNLGYDNLYYLIGGLDNYL